MSSEVEKTNPDNEPEPSPKVDLTPTSDLPQTKKTSRSSLPGGLVEEVLSMFAHSGPTRDPILEKISSKQIDRTIEIRARQQENHHELSMRRQQAAEKLTSQTFLFLGFGLVVILGLCWLFLHYNKTDQVFNLLALIFAGGGGVGVGYGFRRRSQIGTSENVDGDS